MGKKLDRNKPFGVVQGEHNAAFEQDGVAFDIDGNEIVFEVAADPEPAVPDNAPSTADKKPAAAAKKTGGRKKAADPEPASSASVVDEQLAAQGAE